MTDAHTPADGPGEPTQPPDGPAPPAMPPDPFAPADHRLRRHREHDDRTPPRGRHPRDGRPVHRRAPGHQQPVRGGEEAPEHP